jgi:hypothetical protein
MNMGEIEQLLKEHEELKKALIVKNIIKKEDLTDQKAKE